MPPVKELHYFTREAPYARFRPKTQRAWWRAVLNPTEKEKYKFANAKARVGKHWATRDWATLAWDLRWHLGRPSDAWYRDLFTGAGKGQIAGEVTPEYGVLSVEDIERIRNVNPAMKIIFLIRDPIDRSWSAARYIASRGFAGVDLDSQDKVMQMLRAPMTQRRSNYVETLRNYLAVFPAEQILVGFFDAIERDPRGLLSGIWDFLGVEPYEVNQRRIDRVVNKSPDRGMPPEVAAMLRESQRGQIDELAELLGSYAEGWRAKLSGEDAEPKDWPSVVKMSDCELRA